MAIEGVEPAPEMNNGAGVESNMTTAEEQIFYNNPIYISCYDFL